MPVERLTRERRRQQTRDVLVASAAEVFAERGFDGTSLEEVAERAGFTRGAIYKNFAGKEELFFAVIEHLNEQVIEAFRAVEPTGGNTTDWDFSQLAEMWRASVDVYDELFAIGVEFQLYVLRNPAARERAVAHRHKTRVLVTEFIAEFAARAGVTLRLPAATLAAIILAAADGLTFAARIDGEDLFGPFLELLNAGMIGE